MKNNYNPFLAGNSDVVVERCLALLPSRPAMPQEEMERFEAQCSEGAARYHEARYGELPADTYRILEQGGLVGWHLELEIDGLSVVLQEPGEDFTSAYAVYEDQKRAVELARAEIVRRHGEAAAAAAKFRCVWGGSL